MPVVEKLNQELIYVPWPSHNAIIRGIEINFGHIYLSTFPNLTTQCVLCVELSQLDLDPYKYYMLSTYLPALAKVGSSFEEEVWSSH